MKMMKTFILSVAVLSLMTVSGLAQTKIATVDMQKLFNNYWKKTTAQVALDNHKAELRKEIKDLADGLDKAQADYKTLIESANDQTLSADQRDKNRAAAQDKARSIAETKDSIEKIQRQAEAQLTDQRERMSADLVGDIQKAVTDQAKSKGYSLVLNSRALESVVYASTDNDITSDVLKQLNAGAPIDVNQASSTPAAPGGLGAPDATKPVTTTP